MGEEIEEKFKRIIECLSKKERIRNRGLARQTVRVTKAIDCFKQQKMNKIGEK